MFPRVIVSTRIAALAFVLVVGIAGTVGTVFGALAGERGGSLDMTVSRIVELIRGFPRLVRVRESWRCLGRQRFTPLLRLGLPDRRLYRISRGSAVELRDREFVLATAQCRVKPWRLFYSELLPNMLRSLVIVATFDGAQAIVAEATFSFLGLGARLPSPSFGSMISDAKEYMVRQPLYLFFGHDLPGTRGAWFEHARGQFA